MLKSIHQISNPLFNSRTLAAISLSLIASMGVAHAAKNTADSKVEFKSSLPITQEEIAAVNILNEICPKILGRNANFDAGYNRLLSDLLPDIQNPATALKALQDDQDYQQKLAQARQDANKASVDDNREICLEVVQYQPVANQKDKN